MSKPLPCPFCGHAPVANKHGVYCENTDCAVMPELDAMTGPADVEAHIRGWNTRAPDPREAELWQAIDDAMTVGEGDRWHALERIESAAYVLRTR